MSSERARPQVDDRVLFAQGVTGLGGSFLKSGVVIGGGPRCARVKVTRIEDNPVEPMVCTVPWAKLSVVSDKFVGVRPHHAGCYVSAPAHLLVRVDVDRVKCWGKGRVEGDPAEWVVVETACGQFWGRAEWQTGSAAAARVAACAAAPSSPGVSWLIEDGA